MPSTDARAEPHAGRDRARGPRESGNAALEGNAAVTLRRLRIFWAVAHAESLTKASKQLGLAQPSLSQQISTLEQAVGASLFDRRSNRMTLTEAGEHMLRSVEPVLNSVQRLEEGLSEIADGAHKTIRLAGINSALRVLLPPAMRVIDAYYPDIDYDIHESAPADVLDMLYGRRVNVGLIAANSVAPVSTGFLQVPVVEDPYVLAVPEKLRLDGVNDPRTDLDPAARRVLGRSIQFAFGTPHSKRVQTWYDQAIPDNWPFTQARSFEVALGMARAGLGVCLAPAMSSVVGDRPISGLRLYRVDFPPRQIVALLPAQYLRLHPYAELIEALQQVGQDYETPALHDTPPFLANLSAVVGAP